LSEPGFPGLKDFQDYALRRRYGQLDDISPKEQMTSLLN
jgi:hypothetical protein